MRMNSSMYMFCRKLTRFRMRLLMLLLAILSGATGVVMPVAAQTNTGAHPFSFYIPTAVSTATSTIYAGGSSLAPGRVAVDKNGNVFFIGHVSGAASTLYELPAASPVAAWRAG